MDKLYIGISIKTEKEIHKDWLLTIAVHQQFAKFLNNNKRHVLSKLK